MRPTPSETPKPQGRQITLKQASLITGAVLAVLALSNSSQARPFPAWVKSAISTKQPSYDQNVLYVVLLDEAATMVYPSGKAETRYRYVVRLLAPGGREASRREVYYDQDTSISRMHGWHIKPDGKVAKLEKSDIEEESFSDDLYSDSSTRIMTFPDAVTGSVIAYEWVQRERPFINQQYHFFQSRSPVLVSIYRLTLPEDWRVESFVFNHTPFAPAVNNDVYTWELKDLPPISQEPLMPAITSVSPYVAVSYFPSEGRVAKKSFSGWQDVSKWVSQLVGKRSVPNAEIEAKARDLTAGANSEFEKASAIARWIEQQIRYVSIQLGTKSGYQPHQASLVFNKGYGDCKDKVCLMQAMLRAVGIRSEMVLVYSGDPTRVRAEFPSVLQFNHAIIALGPGAADKVPGGEETGAAPRTSADLLFFDPTDAATPLGDLPYYLQGSLGLVVNGDEGHLVKLPVSTANANTAQREMDVALDANGAIVASVRETLRGQIASATLRQSSCSDPEQCSKAISAKVWKTIPGAKVAGITVRSKRDLSETISMEYTVTGAGYASQTGKIMVVKPLSFWAVEFPTFSSLGRQEPVEFEMESIQDETVAIKIPPGERIDEVPAGTEIKAPFGEFAVTYAVDGLQVTVHRRLALLRKTVAASDYKDLRTFFDTAKRSSDAGLVLIRE
ncbi:MAG TPA: DUF3857 domain-containing protein [Blastocatellia bacterium]|nr:DUF3857 domain-containing protein [Blastocatellia bacterium]